MGTIPSSHPRLRRGSSQLARSTVITLVVGIASGATGINPGVLAMRSLAIRCAARTDLRFADISHGPVATLAGDLAAGCELIAIGESKLGAAPGLVTMLAGQAADHLLASREYREQSQVLADALELLRRVGQLPRRRAVLNIEPPPVASLYAPRFVAASVARAAAQGLALVETWRLLERLELSLPGAPR